METWFVTHVRKDTHDRINSVWARPNLITSIGGRAFTRSQAMASIDAGNEWKTAITIHGELQAMADIHVVEAPRTLLGMGPRYLRTDRDETARDNLDNLPEF